MEEEKNNRIFKKEVRLTKNEKDFIDQIVKSSGINFSAYTRHLYFRKNINGVNLILDNVETKRHFHNLCNNFNQLLKLTHTTRQPIPNIAVELEKILKLIKNGYS